MKKPRLQKTQLPGGGQYVLRACLYSTEKTAHPKNTHEVKTKENFDKHKQGGISAYGYGHKTIHALKAADLCAPRGPSRETPKSRAWQLRVCVFEVCCRPPLDRVTNKGVGDFGELQNFGERPRIFHPHTPIEIARNFFLPLRTGF